MFAKTLYYIINRKILKTKNGTNAFWYLVVEKNHGLFWSINETTLVCLRKHSIVKDSPSRSILNTFCSQIGGSIARYNAMAAHAWVQNYIRSSHISVGEVAG